MTAYMPWGLLIVVMIGILAAMMSAMNSRTRRLKQAKPEPYIGINAGYRNVEDWMKLAQVTPDEGACSRCGTYGPYDDVSAVYRSMQMCYWCAELERERTRLIVEPK